MKQVATAKLGDIAAFIRGVTYKPNDVSSADDSASIPCMRTKNVQHDLDDTDLVYIPRLPIKSDKLLRKGDIIVSSANSWNLVGKCSWVPHLSYEATFGGFTSVLRADESNVFPRYLYHWFSTADVQSLARSFGQQTTNISNLNLKRCLELEIPFPPLDEQRRIAAILDKADALRRKRKRALELLDGLTQSIFLEMFGDPALNPRGYRLVSFRDLSVKISDGPFGSNLKSEHYVDQGVRVIRLQNIGVDEFVDADRAFITAEHFKSLAKHECLPGDVLVGTLGDPNLRACVQPELLHQALNKADCVQMRVDPEKAVVEYIVALINQPSTEAMAQSSIMGQTRARISMGRFRELSVPIAPLSEQKRFAEIYRRIKANRAKLELHASSCDTQFASLQHRAFSGRL